MAPSQESQAEMVTVNASDLRNAQNKVIMHLATIQQYVADLNKAYLEHANNLANGGPATINLPNVPDGFHPGHFDRAGSPAAKSEAGGVKKRKRAPVDPNAPKRPLTPYFLYMHNNRAVIAKELGSDARPKEVSDEGTKRWQEMPESQKSVWKELYNENYEKYKGDVAAYKASGRKADDDLDPAANQLQQDFAVADQNKTDSSSSESENEQEDESSPSPPPKEKTPRSTKRRRSDAKASKEAPDSATKQASPVKKGRGRKAADPAKETPAPKGKGKKRKSEA